MVAVDYTHFYKPLEISNQTLDQAKNKQFFVKNGRFSRELKNSNYGLA